MALPTTPPNYNGSWKALQASIRRGELNSWRVWALQNCMWQDPSLRPSMEATGGRDGSFGPGTEKSVKKWQTDRKLIVDGIVGPQTQLAMLAEAEHDVHADVPGLPEGVLKGFSVAEGGSVLAATNWYTPPGDPPGVDLGPMQLRYLLPIAIGKMQEAFDPRFAMVVAGKTLLLRMDRLRRAQPQLSSPTVLRVALLAHNAPFLYEQVRLLGGLRTPNASAGWTWDPNKSRPYTHAEWYVEYPNRILVYVK